ncbi:MAG TPA: hypothetical protein PLT67_02410 [Kiritimatiellia bacterium]|nr:hypothetical protein [Kiritimatiellia bacterium]HQQ03670.1 hypothetical protein [Kiritimatiellia bacterium]
MSRVQIILLLAAGIMALESLWGLINPREIKETIGRLLPGMPPRQPGMGVFFLSLALLLWLAVPRTADLSSWLLLVVVLFTATMGIACLKENAFRGLAGLLIVNRSPVAIRLIYAAEMALAAFMIWAALNGR